MGVFTRLLNFERALGEHSLSYHLRPATITHEMSQVVAPWQPQPPNEAFWVTASVHRDRPADCQQHIRWPTLACGVGHFFCSAYA